MTCILIFSVTQLHFFELFAIFLDDNLFRIVSKLCKKASSDSPQKRLSSRYGSQILYKTNHQVLLFAYPALNICKAEWATCPFICPKCRCEGCKSTRIFMHSNLVIARSKIEFSKIFLIVFASTT